MASGKLLLIIAVKGVDDMRWEMDGRSKKVIARNNLLHKINVSDRNVNLYDF